MTCFHSPTQPALDSQNKTLQRCALVRSARSAERIRSPRLLRKTHTSYGVRRPKEFPPAAKDMRKEIIEAENCEAESTLRVRRREFDGGKKNNTEGRGGIHEEEEEEMEEDEEQSEGSTRCRKNIM